MKSRSIIKYAALTAIFLVLFIPNLVYTFPFIVGADGSYTVMSGSMSPVLNLGDLVIVEKTEPSNIDVGDMVTVESEDFTYTHRVVEVMDNYRFRLKGDANEDPDSNPIEASQIVGRVFLIFPFSHLYTSYGFALALIVPAALIIGRQMYTIHQFTKKRNKKETMRWKRKSRRSAMLSTGTLLLALILTVSTTRIIAPHFLSGSSSYFYDKESSGELFRVDIWKVPSEITCMVSESEITLGQNVIISGSIDPAISAEVTIEYSLDEVLWTLIVKKFSDPDGSYDQGWTPPLADTYKIRARWAGNVYYFGDTSETELVVS